MKELIIATLFMAALAGLTGCGHNVFTYTTGQRLNIGINPQTQETGIQYLDAEQITVVEKDNAKLTVELSSGLDENGKKTTRVSKIVYEIKEQITDADIDLEAVKKK